LSPGNRLETATTQGPLNFAALQEDVQNFALGKIC